MKKLLKNTRIRNTIGGVILLGILVFAGAYSVKAEKDKAVIEKALATQVEELESTIKSLETELSTLQTKYDEEVSHNKELQANYDKLHVNNQAVLTKLDEVKKELRTLQQK